MARGGKKEGAGRPKGVANKSTIQAREAIARFVDDNSHRFQEWLDAVANGRLEDGTVIGPPNPEKAFNMVQAVIEYHVPKLARTELTGADGKPVSVQIVDDVCK
jgi:hypothetical protein